MFGLDGGGVLSAEAELRDGHVIQDDVEVLRPLEQLSADQQGNLEDVRVVSVTHGEEPLLRLPAVNPPRRGGGYDVCEVLIQL